MMHLTEDFDFSVYPNPAKDYAILRVGGLKDEVKVYFCRTFKDEDSKSIHRKQVKRL